jgi:transposase
MIGDKAYDSDKLDREMKAQKVKMIAPHKENRRLKPTQDGRELRRYKRRWKVERLFAWIQNFRRCNTRYEYYEANFLGFVQLACIIILIRNYF